MKNASRGFTYVELLVVVLVVAVLASIATFVVHQVGARARLTVAQSKLAAAWLAGVSHAAGHGVEVVFCPGSEAGCRKGVDWENGWILFADNDGNRMPSAGEKLLASEAPLNRHTRLRSTVGRTRVVFQPNGSNAGSNITWVVCDSQAPDKSISVVVGNGGRIRHASLKGVQPACAS